MSQQVLEEDPQREVERFIKLDQDFQEVLKQLTGDKSLERFRIEYEKLHRALKKSHENEQRLIKACEKLNKSIVTDAAQIKKASELSQKDNEYIKTLKSQLENANKAIETLREKEQRNKAVINELKNEIQSLGKIIEEGSGLNIGQDNTINELLRAQDELGKERDQLNEDVARIQGELKENEERKERL